MIEAEAAIAAAKEGLDKINVEDQPGLAAVRATCQAGVPILVRRLDQPDGAYYLVPCQDDEGIKLVVQVDAKKGVMSSAAWLSTPLTRLTITPQEAEELVFERLGLEAIGSPRLVWQPCRESTSPWRPFYQVLIDEGTIFVGMDKAVHRSLTPLSKGGG